MALTKRRLKMNRIRPRRRIRTAFSDQIRAYSFDDDRNWRPDDALKESVVSR